MSSLATLTLDEFKETYPTFANLKLRVDQATQKASVIDVIRFITGYKSGNASNYFNRLELTTTLSTKCSKLQINGKGRATPCADAPTLVEIIWELPGKAAKDFRRQSAHYICRILGGDRSLIDEIEMRFDRTNQAQKEFMLANTQRPQLPERSSEELAEVRKRKYKDLDLINAQLAVEERKDQLMQMQIATKVAYMDGLHAEIKLLESIGLFDDCTKLSIKDRITNYESNKTIKSMFAE